MMCSRFKHALFGASVGAVTIYLWRTIKCHMGNATADAELQNSRESKSGLETSSPGLWWLSSFRYDNDDIYYPSPPYTLDSIKKWTVFQPAKDKRYVIINTFPKSGTTWMIYVVYQILTRGRAFQPGENIDDQYLWYGSQPSLHSSFASLDSLPTNPGLLKAHSCFEHTPHNSKQIKEVYVCRDPADALVSYAKMKKALDPNNPGIKEFVKHFTDGQFVYGNWVKHVSGYWQAAKSNPEQYLFVFFEDMKRDFRSVLDRISSFLNDPVLTTSKGEDKERKASRLTSAEIDQICDHCSLDYMKDNAAFQPKHLGAEAEEGSAIKRGKFAFVGKGKIGGASQSISDEQRQCVYQYCAEQLEVLGSDFPFHDRYHL